ncbi:hypothetical protein [Haloferula sp. BvORR071]|uniref:hypothetical protein n=1 Tax=Haloferula sp. BvORR071 TaxID=1396141 RepID=UPI0005598901|nr:hypothetical protein [Haloferula sp. BvORR071]
MNALRSLLASVLASLAVASAAPPVNDNFASATADTSTFWLASGTLHEATSEANEPILNGYPNGQTIWWKWTAKDTATYRVRTWGSEADVMLGLYRGTSLDDLRLISYASSHFERAHSAQANMDVVSGKTYYIQVLGTDNLSPTATADALLPSRVQVSLTRVSGALFPVNDNFASASPISGTDTEVFATNSLAGSEAGEPLGIAGNAGNTIWFNWTAPGSGTYSIDTQRSDFDNMVAVYTGAAVNSLTRIDYASDTFGLALGQAFGGGRVNFKAVSGTTYRIQLQGAVVNGLAEHGVCRLALKQVSAPINDDFANATTLTGSAPSGDGWTTYATREAGEPAAAMDESKSIWWNWTAPSTGVLAVAMMEGTVEPFTGASVNALTLLPTDPRSGTRPTLGAVTFFYQVTSGTVVRLRGGDEYNRVRFSLRMIQSPAHDDFANRLLLSGPTATNTTDLEFASWQNNEPGIDGLGPPTVWYRWTAPSTARFVIDSAGSVQFNRVKVFTGTALDSLVSVGSEKIGSTAGNTFGRILLDATSGTEYAIQLRRENNYNGSSKLNIHAIAVPANDNFANAINMTGSAWTANGTNVDASREDAGSEPLSGLSDPYASSTVWWKWTAPAAGRYRVSLAGSSFDSVLGIYTGSALNALTNVAKDQSGGWNSSGALFLNATNGTQYFFQVDGNSFQEGSVQLSLAPAVAPPNDAFANRLVLSGAAVTASGTVTAATAEGGEVAIPSAAGNSGHSVWYEWTAPSSGKALIRVTAPRFAPAWGIYTGTAVNSLFPAVTLGSGAPSATEAQSQFGVTVSSGSIYKIAVDGNPTDTGNFTISITMSAAPLNDNFAARTLISGNVVRTSSDNVGARNEASEPVHAGTAATNSVWWEWTAAASGPVTLDTNGSTASPRLAVYTGSALASLSPIASAATAAPFTTLNFTAVAGTSYKIAADSTDSTRGLIILNLVTAAAAPANDAFANAIVWNTDQAESLAYPRGASFEASEPAPGGRAAAKSLWWAWTPQTTRHARIWMETETTGLLARIAVYRGSALNSLVPITAQTSDAHWGRLEFDALAGETYRIVVDTPSAVADPGWVKLGVVPVNGNLDNSYLIAPTANPFTVNTTGAYEVDSVQAPTARRTLWWAWTTDVCVRMEWRAVGVPGSGTTVSVTNAGSGQPVPGSGDVSITFDAVPDVLYFVKVSTLAPGPVDVQLRESLAQAPPANDRFYSALALSGDSWSIPVTLGNETENRLYWRWTASTAGIAELKLSGALAESDALLAFADGETSTMTAGASRTNGGAPTLRLKSTVGQQWVFVSQSSLQRTRAATLSLLAPAPGAAPANDNWENAQVLAAAFGTINGDITNASCQPFEPDHSNSNGTGSATQFPPGRSVWYDWTPSTTGPVSLRLQSTASLALQLYRGNTRQQWLTSGFLAPGAPSFTANVVAGQTYHIAVATRPYNETTSSFALSLGGPANDLFANASTLNGSSATDSVESTGASIETGEPGYATSLNPSKASLWWKWTAPNSNGVWVDTLGSEYDTVLTVFTTDPPTIPAILTENDNASTLPGAGASLVAFKPVAAQTYWFRLTRAAGDTSVSGIARINLSSTAPIADPWQRWLAANPTLSGPNALDTADPDNDGVSNLMELALGSNPLAGTLFPITQTITPQGFQVEALLDRTALSGLAGVAPIDASWQVSYDLKTWLPGPAATIVGTQGKLTRERITLPWNGPRFARLVVTRTH